jgi:ATP-dependent DNA helicase RecQ
MQGGDAGEPTTDRSAGSQRVAALLAALAAAPGGLTGPELLIELRRRWPNLSEPQLRRLIATAGAAMRAVEDRFFAAQPISAAVGPATMGTSLRAVAFDLEALPRLRSTAPYVERAVWQIGAVRFGRDSAWVNANPRMVAWVEIPPGYEVPTAAAARHRAAARAPASVYGELSKFCSGADVLVAYNGTGLDFGALDDACDRAGVRRIDEPERVDALYLAYTWWPTAAGHHSTTWPQLSVSSCRACAGMTPLTTPRHWPASSPTGPRRSLAAGRTSSRA